MPARWRPALLVGFVALSILMALFLIGPLRLVWETRDDALPVGDSLQRAGVIVGLVTLGLGVPALLLLAVEVRALASQCDLRIDFRQHAPAEDSQTFAVDLYIHNRSNVAAQHFRLLVYGYTPRNPDDEAGGLYPVNAGDWSVLDTRGVHLYSERERAQAAHLLPVEPPAATRQMLAWELRIVDRRIYPQDRILLLQLDVFGPELIVDWRLDFDGGSRRGRKRFERSPAASDAR